MSYQRILVTLDGSELAESALRHVTEIARPGAQVHVLSVLTRDLVAEFADVRSVLGSVFAVPSEEMPPVRRATNPQEVYAREDYLHRASDFLKELGYRVTVEVLPGEVVDTIVGVAWDGFDVVVMATHGRTGLRRLALGSVAEAVLWRARCPVLVVPVREYQF